MCHAFLTNSSLYSYLTQLDQDIAQQVQSEGCPCGGKLHRSDYPRKPRGIRGVLDKSYETRISFCCSVDGCRKRCTPPSVRFLGRKVYLGVIVVLLAAMHHGLTPKRRHQLIEQLNIPAQTLSRWRHWWSNTFVQSRCWQYERGRYVPPINENDLPGSFLGRLMGENLEARLKHLLWLIKPVTSDSFAAI